MPASHGESLWTLFIASATTVGVAIGTVFDMTTLDNASMFLVSVCFNALFLATIGSLIAIMLGAEPIKPPRRMWLLFTASALIGASSVAVLPHIPMLEWTGKIPPQAMAFLMGFGMRYAIPMAEELAPEWVRKKLGLAAKREGAES